MSPMSLNSLRLAATDKSLAGEKAATIFDDKAALFFESGQSAAFVLDSLVAVALLAAASELCQSFAVASVKVGEFSRFL